MADVKIVIRTEADLAAARQTSAEFDRLKKSTDATAAATGQLDIKKKDLRKSIKELGHAIPGVGSALLLLYHPITLVAGAIAGVILAIRHFIGEQSKLADSAADVAAKLTPLEGALRRPGEAMRETERAAKDLKAALDAVTQAARDPGKQLTEQEAEIEKQLEREKELLRLRKEAVDLRIESDVASGSITEHEGRRRKIGAAEFFTKEGFRLEDEAREKKRGVQAKGHLAAQQDFRGALDANADAVARVKEAKERLAAFDLGEKAPGGLAAQRSARDAELAKDEQAAMVNVARWQSIHQRDIDAEMRSGRGILSPLAKQRLAGSVSKKALDRVEGELAGIRAERKSIGAAGQAQEQKRLGLAGEVSAAEAFQKETVSAASRASGRAEATRKGFVDLGREGTTAAGHFQSTFDLQSVIARLQNENQLLKELAAAQEKADRETERTLRKMTGDLNHHSQQLEALHGR